METLQKRIVQVFAPCASLKAMSRALALDETGRNYSSANPTRSWPPVHDYYFHPPGQYSRCGYAPISYFGSSSHLQQCAYPIAPRTLIDRIASRVSVFRVRTGFEQQLDDFLLEGLGLRRSRSAPAGILHGEV